LKYSTLEIKIYKGEIMFASRRSGLRFAPQLTVTRQKPASTMISSTLIANPIDKTNAQKNPHYDLRTNYRKRFELATIFSLLLVCATFFLLRDIRTAPREVAAPNIKIEVAEIPPTEQIKRPPPPPRPAAPIPTESEDVPDDVTIESTELRLAELPPPPPPPSEQGFDEESPVFVAYDEPPEIIGGMEALLSSLEYPELARRAGIEGNVVIGVLIDEKGKLLNAKVLKPHGAEVGLEDAAIKALRKMKWKPAYQRDKPIKVWVSIPVRFKLRDAT
jgi:protein TonB